MNSLIDNIYTASGVVQDKKVRVRVLGRGAHSKSKLHSLPQADRNWKPIHAYAFGEANEGSTQYLYSSWSQTSGSLHGQLECHFTQAKRTATGLGGRRASS